MSNRNQYNKLLQQKRSELPIDQDSQADWAEMHKALDALMPLGTGAVATQSGFKTILAHIAKFKLLYTLTALLTTGTATYILINRGTIVQTKQHNHAQIKKENVNNADNSNIQNSSTNVTIPDSVINKTTVADNNSITNVTEKYLDNNKTKASAPGNHTNTVAGMVGVTPGINNSENKSLSPVNNKSDIAKRLSFTNNKPSLSADHTLGTPSSGGLGVLSRSHRNNGRLGNSQMNFSNPASRIVNSNNAQGEMRKIRAIAPGTGRPATDLPDYNKRQANVPVLQAWPPQFIVYSNANILTNGNAGLNVINKTVVNPANVRALVAVKTKNKTAFSLPLDWGILGGINAPGSFTAANKKTTNGVPFDVYGGLFATYNLNNKWAINLQTKLPSPHQVSGSYSHTEKTKADTGQAVQTATSKITDSRKMYTGDIVLHLVYNVAPNIGVKMGPVLSIPLKQANGVSSVSTSGTLKDTVAYYSKLTDAINGTNIEKKIRYGISGGIGLNYKRFLLDATYYHGFQTQKVSSSLGGYTSNTNSLQITIGFRINKKQ